MDLDMMNILAVVPARGGSKGIPRKNLCEIAGVSLIGHVGQVIRQLPWIDKAVISTDDSKMAEEGKRYGIDAPFFRPEALSSDNATGVDTWKHALVSAEKHYGIQFDISVYLEPTSPFRQAVDIERTVLELASKEHLAAATVSRTPGSYTPHKTLTIDEKGDVAFYLKEGRKFSIRQKIPSYYHRNGICYAMKRDALLACDCILTNRCAAVIIDRDVVNIDEPVDLEFARMLFEKK